MVTTMVLNKGFLVITVPSIAIASWEADTTAAERPAAWHPVCDCPAKSDSSLCKSFETRLPQVAPFVDIGCISPPRSDSVRVERTHTFVATALQVCTEDQKSKKAPSSILCAITCAMVKAEI